jgi:hypothetical protein
MKKIILIALFLSQVPSRGAEFEPTNFYSRFSSFSFLEMSAVTDLVQDEEKREKIVRNLIFVAFNYFCSTQKGLVRPNEGFEKILRHVYSERTKVASWSDSFQDPLQWPKEAEQPVLMLQKEIMLESREAYSTAVQEFAEFLKK